VHHVWSDLIGCLSPFLIALAVLAAESPARAGQAGPSGASADDIETDMASLREAHAKMGAQLAHMMPVRMRVSPELAIPGEEVTVDLEVLAEKSPNTLLEFLPRYFANEMKARREIRISWSEVGRRHGRAVYRWRHRFRPEATGNYLLHWACDIGGDIPDFWRSFAVVDDTYAVCLFESTSHAVPRPDDDFHKLYLPFDFVETAALMLPRLAAKPDAAAWAALSRNHRQYGDKPIPFLFAHYYARDFGPEGDFAGEPDAVQRAVLSAYREMWPMLGFDAPMDCFASYSIGNGPVRTARSLGYSTISLLCSGQNWQDGSFRINHSGMPDRPFFISTDDFRKAGDGGPKGLVGIPQCQRNTFLCHDYNCVYSLEPAWNIFPGDGGRRWAGRAVIDELSMSRLFDFFDAMLQQRLSHSVPYVFTVGIEFNGVLPGIVESNRMLMEYAVKKARTVPVAFSTGPAVTDFFRRHYDRTPETTCYQQDYFCGQTSHGKPAGYPDTLEIEGPCFKSLFKAPEILPYYHYDYLADWDYPDWGNESLPRNERGYLAPGTYDRFEAVPRILDTRRFRVSRSDAETENGLTITIVVEAEKDQANLALALWDIPRAWQEGTGWWRVSGKARFVPVRAPYTGNLNGVLVADVAGGANTFTVTVSTPPRALQATTVRISDSIEGRVYARDGGTIAYLWPTGAQRTTLVVDLPEGTSARGYVAEEGAEELCAGEGTRFELQVGGWMRLVGLSVEEVARYCRAE